MCICIYHPHIYSKFNHHSLWIPKGDSHPKVSSEHLRSLPSPLTSQLWFLSLIFLFCSLIDDRITVYRTSELTAFAHVTHKFIHVLFECQVIHSFYCSVIVLRVLWIYHSCLSWSPGNGHLGCLHLLTIMKESCYCHSYSLCLKNMISFLYWELDCWVVSLHAYLCDQPA